MQSLQNQVNPEISIRFFNKDLEFIGEIDNFKSTVYVRRWETFGTFEIHLEEDRPELFVEGYYIMLNNDAYRSGIIQYYKNDSDGYEPKSQKDIVIKGYSLLYLLYWRITVPPATNNGYRIWNNKPIEDIMYDLVNENAVNPSDSKRKIPQLTMGTSQHRGGKLTFQTRLKYLTDDLYTLSRQSGLGVSIKLDAARKRFVFEVLEGRDCTYGIENPHSYIFSKANNKVNKRTYTYSTIGAKNMAYIGGQGDGDDREIVTLHDELAGLERKEMFVDARDIPEGQTDNLLDRGNTKLEATKEVVSYEFDASTEDYGMLWDLGDTATFVDESGFIEDNRITEVREAYEGSVLRIDPVFGHTEQTIVNNLHTNSVEMTNERVGISASFKYLYAENATIKNAIIEKADIKDLNAVTATVETLRAQTAEIQVLVADKASIGDLNAATARITELEADTADIRKAIIDVAHIGDLTAITADITSLKADVADIDTAMIGKADIDLANIKNGCITTAMIGTGVIGTTQIADGSITDAKIVGLTANKITAGRLDAALIEVVNLNAANITVGTINGVQIAPGAITGDKLAQQVNDQITGAANAAQQAQTTADGKNKIYYQNTQPGLTGNKKGDTWFDTANGYRAYVWNGTAWSLSPFGSAAIADDAVTLAKVGADLQSFMDDINSKALAAQTSADGKNTVFYQATQPPTTGRKTGDTWYNTAKDNAISKWDGSKWTEITFGAGAISDSIISADKLSTDIVNQLNTAASDAATAKATANTAKTNAATAQSAADAAKATLAAWCYNNNLTYIDGGDIYTGTVTAAKIAAEAISTEKLAANAVTADKITAGTITGDKIAGKTISADKIVAGTITAQSGVIANGAILSAMIGDAQIGTAKIANLAVTGAKIANATITNAQIADATIQSAKIAALDAGKITTGILAAARIAAGSITTDKLASKSITVGQISDTAIKGINDLITIGARNLLRNSGTPTTNTTYGTRVFNTSGLKPNTKYTFVVNGFTSSVSQKIGLWFNGGSSGGFFVNPTTTVQTQYVVVTTPASLTTTNVSIYNYPSGSTSCTINWACLYEGEIKPPMDWTPAPEDDTTAIAENSIANWCYNNNLTYINGGNIYTGTVTATQIAANAIIADKIAANAVTTATIAAGAINADKLAANSVIAGKIAANAVTAGTIAAGSINADKLAAGAVTADKLAADAVTADKIVADAITTAKIAAKAVTANEIAAGTITAAQIAANAITATQLAAGAVTAAKIAAGQITADKIAAGAITADKFYGTAITSKNYVANSAGTKIDLTNGIIDTKNFKVSSAGDVSMTGDLSMQGTQTVTIKNASAAEIGRIQFKAKGWVSHQAYDGTFVGGTQQLLLSTGYLGATTCSTTMDVGLYPFLQAVRSGNTKSLSLMAPGSTEAVAGITMNTGQSPYVQAFGCTKIVDFTVASGCSKPSGELNNIVYNSMGKFCLLSFSLTGNVAAGTHTKVLTVPAGYRPPGLIFSAGAGGVYGWFQIALQADGGLYVWHPSGMTSFRGTILYYL